MSYFCENCDNYITESKYCFGCESCQTCCKCTRPKFFRNKLTFFVPTSNQKKKNKSSRFISAEVEVAGIKKYKQLIEEVVQKWKGNIVYDGTLPPSGFEINTAPAGGDLYARQINDICDKLEEAGAVINNECGLHVHIDARDYNYADLHRLVRVYAAIEPALFSMVPAHRRESAYTLKCADKLEGIIKSEKVSHIEQKHRVVTAIYGAASSAARLDKRGAGPGTGRYYALNLHSWFFRGTIECRLFDGTLDKNEIINWGVLWANILDFTLRLSDDEVSDQMNKEKPLDSLLHIVKGKSELESFILGRYNKHFKTPKGPKTKAVLWNEIFAD